jgi:hypothetical protein
MLKEFVKEKEKAENVEELDIVILNNISSNILENAMVKAKKEDAEYSELTLSDTVELIKLAKVKEKLENAPKNGDAKLSENLTE